MAEEGQDQGNNDAGDQGDQGGEAHWTSGLENVDHRNNATLKKYDTQEAANNGHLQLQSSMGMDKQVWPKDANDTERWAEVNARLGVPEKSDGYNLGLVDNPDGIQLLDRAKFQENMHQAGAPQAVAEKIWDSYHNGIKEGYADAKKAFQDNIDTSKAALMAEWGESYEAKVQMGNNVIEVMGNTQEQKDALTVSLAQSSDGIKFLADIGALLKESSVGGFQENTTFTLSPAEARVEIDRIRGSSDYNSPDERVRGPVIERMNSLMQMAGPRL